MGKPPLSAVYFVRTPEVDEFLEEFIRVRSWHILENMGTSQSTGKDTSLVPRRRNVDTNSDDKDEVLVDDMLDVAKEMSHGSSIHLDAFISLVVNHNEFIDVLTNEEYDAIKPKRFKLYEIMKNTSITDRKIPKPRESTDLQSVLREAEERRYQRLVSNVQSKFKSTKSEVSAYKPPIIGGANAIFGVILTFIGGYSVAGVVGVKDNMMKAIIATVCASAALIVDTILFLMRS
ncbi:Endoplasmic reticulum-based factor for assembly of V-ATPase family protein [Babesia bovis T2Bo]|uniref:Endoplasmic reticulum-based factor for assembly of V-ATPase family protein n=1 Tax=Babesia bovis T2Bo TaxID=484906 RepID=UPI001C35DA93|nr:Endoplasmic reticulum-based factor for assembly of V-ATPase family protein [Babesia bovis T2Bo]EDO08611.2 Endoplasmic reticulum-based factor for assembly of V-ATPase family protein [Babesia bovis T2Bo]